MVTCSACGNECAAVDDNGMTCCDFADRDGVRRLIALLRKERDRYREALNLRNTCAHCKCSLIDDESPPHCECCIVTDEDEERWRDAKEALKP